MIAIPTGSYAGNLTMARVSTSASDFWAPKWRAERAPHSTCFYNGGEWPKFQSIDSDVPHCARSRSANPQSAASRRAPVEFTTWSTLTVPQQIVLRNCSEIRKNLAEPCAYYKKRKFVLSITSRTKAKSSVSYIFSRNGVSHEHKEPESPDLPRVSLVALGPSKTSSSGMARPGGLRTS